MGHQCFIFRETKDIKVAQHLPDAQYVVPHEQERGDVRLLDCQLAHLLEVLQIVDHDETPIARQNHALCPLLKRHFVDRETLINQHLDHLVL